MLESHNGARRNGAGLVEERNRCLAEMSEREMLQAMASKDAVIREVHHRTKNTLQIAGNLLLLQARASPLPEVRRALMDSAGRLRLLAKIHEMLHLNAGSTQLISMRPLFDAVGDALRQLFAEMSNRVRLHVTSDHVRLSPDRAIPMALLANEAITNAYKHAFPDGFSGEINVDLRCLPEGGITLRIIDNGIGMRSRRRENGLGLKLLGNFAAQLQGTLEFAKPKDATGTAVTWSSQNRLIATTEPLDCAPAA